MDVLFKGIDNHGLRTLSQGRFTGVEITRSIKEAALIHELLHLIRGQGDRTGLDIDTLAFHLAHQDNKPTSNLLHKKEAYQAVAFKIFTQMQEWIPASTSTADKAVMDKVKALEDKIAEMTLAKVLQPNAKKPRTIFDRLQRGAALPMDENQLADEDLHEDPTPLADLERGSRPRVLSKNSPAGCKPQEITSWISKLTLTSAKKAKLKSTTDKMTVFYNNLPKIQQAGLNTLAVEWGLSLRLASKMADAGLLRPAPGVGGGTDPVQLTLQCSK